MPVTSSQFTDSNGIEYTTEQWTNEQTEDPKLKLILYWLKNNENPHEGEIYIADPGAKKYFVNTEQFFLDEN